MRRKVSKATRERMSRKFDVKRKINVCTNTNVCSKARQRGRGCRGGFMWRGRLMFAQILMFALKQEEGFQWYNIFEPTSVVNVCIYQIASNGSNENMIYTAMLDSPRLQTKKRKCSSGPEHSGPQFREAASFSSMNTNFTINVHRPKRRRFRKGGLECHRSTPVTPNYKLEYNFRLLSWLDKRVNETTILMSKNFKATNAFLVCFPQEGTEMSSCMTWWTWMLGSYHLVADGNLNYFPLLRAGARPVSLKRWKSICFCTYERRKSTGVLQWREYFLLAICVKSLPGSWS